ncbi:MAG: radical SAM protein [Candidatus Helarchaeales archaeon]
MSLFYVEPVYRPPSEAKSLLITATIGCSSAAAGHCYFCGSYLIHKFIPKKRFRVRPINETIQDIKTAREIYGNRVRRIFFLDSNAFVMKPDDLIKITQEAYKHHPNLERVSTYACAQDILRKSDEDLKRIRESGLQLLYLGLESGSNEVLELQNKGVSVEDTIKACIRAKNAGFKLSITVILGLGGKELSEKHARETGIAISKINPEYLGALTLMIIRGSPIESWIKKGTFTPLETDEFLKELKIMLENINVRDEMVFRTNHASNYLPLKGTLPADKDSLLALIQKALDKKIALRPEFLRGL